MPGPIRILMPDIFPLGNDQRGRFAMHGMQVMSSMVDGIEKGLQDSGIKSFGDYPLLSRTFPQIASQSVKIAAYVM